jgi:hypothetical protein
MQGHGEVMAREAASYPRTGAVAMNCSRLRLLACLLLPLVLNVLLTMGSPRPRMAEYKQYKALVMLRRTAATGWPHSELFVGSSTLSGDIG